ncbi:MAG: oligosaccharide flippase family protein [Clostridiales bacterium]|nr:oligosaccharide flippase family protein [Clostridiales bacterium]
MQSDKTTLRKFWRGAGSLTLAAIAAKCLGALYRIPLTRALGAHGMGMYQSVFPLYALLVTLCGGGLTAAVSKLVAENEGRAALKTATVTALCFSVPLALIAAAFARVIAAAAGAPAAAVALAVLLPSVPLSAVCAALRGYFQGLGNMTPSAVGQCVEQLAKFAAGLTLSYALARVSLTAAVAGCAAGVTVSEGMALAYFYRRYRKNGDSEGAIALPPVANGEPTAVENVFTGIEALSETSAELAPPALVIEAASHKKSLAARLWKVALPVTLGLMVLPLCQVADSFIVVNLLVRSGVAREYSTALYGLVTGPISAMVNMPAVLTVGVCGTLLPRVSALIKRGGAVRRTVGRVLVFSLVSGVVFCAGIIVVAPFALRILYGASLGAPIATVTSLLRMASVAVLCIAVMQTASAALQGGGKAYLPACNLFAAAVVKEVLNFVLLPRLGIYGFVIATDVFYALACLLDCIALIAFLRKTH